MSTRPNPNRKASDDELLRKNSVGLSQASIARLFDMHPVTVKDRLQLLGVKPTDTRRSFMEDIYNRLTPQQQQWLEDQLGPHHSVKDFVASLLTDQFIRQTRDTQHAA